MADLLLTCPDGLEELLRGDLQDAGLRAGLAGPGLLRLSAGQDVLPHLMRRPLVDRVAVDLGPDGADAGGSLAVAQRLCRAAGYAGDLAFRVGAPDAATRDAAIDAIERSTGWANAPGDWQLNVDLTARRVEIGPLAWAARFGRLERLPATTPPTVAAGLLRLAKLRDDDRLLDPCAGVGSIPIVDALVRPGGLGLAIDVDPASVAAARTNVAAHGLGDRVEVETGDASALDLPDAIADRVVSDLPFGRRVGSNAGNRELYPAILREVARVLTADGRAVLLTDDKRTFADAVRCQRGLKVVKQTPVRYNGVSPTAYSLTRVRQHPRDAAPRARRAGMGR